MNIKSNIPVMNNCSVGIESVEVLTSCISTIDFIIPVSEIPKQKTVVIELSRKHLIEFLLRTQPNLSMQLGVSATNSKDSAQ